MTTIGPLVPADEGFSHQIADTFATVGSSDPSWTEKVCAMAAARDGSLQLGFGLGKYTNRNVMDALRAASPAASSRSPCGRAAASRPSPSCTVDRPDPLRGARAAAARCASRSTPTTCQPIAFDWVFEAVVPPLLEDRTHTRAGYRVSADLVRYHQIGVGSGWVEVDGERTEIDPDTWVSTRDHSWGVRYDVGAAAHRHRAARLLAIPGRVVQHDLVARS